MKQVFQTIAILLLGSGVVMGTAWVVNRYKEPTVIKEPVPVEKIVEKVLVPPTCAESFDAYQELVSKGQKLQLVQSFSSYAANRKFVRERDVRVGRDGAVACGYLYVRASKNNQPLDNDFDSVYINPQGFGGHLLRSRSIALSQQPEGATEVLFPLTAVPYLPSVPYDSDAQNFKISNWARLLGVTNEVMFSIALSTENPAGLVEDVSLVYKCWDPTTGIETSDCTLQIIN